MIHSLNISEIARACNTSPTTVSRVLNGKPDVRPETRERVLAVLKERDYQPRLGRVTLNGIGVYVPSGRPLAGFYYSELLDGIAEAVFAQGCALTIVTDRLLGECEENGLEMLIRQQRLMGLLFIGEVDDRVLAAARQQRVRHVVVDRSRPPQNTVAVATDIAGGVRQAAEHLLRLGHRRIILLNGPDTNGRDGLRAEGLRQAFNCAGVPIDSDSVITIEWSRANGRPTGLLVDDAIGQLWSRPAVPTALIGAGEWVTIPALSALVGRGMRLPHDVSFVAFHDAPSARYFHPSLTAIRQPIHDLGSLAVNLLVRLAAGDQIATIEPQTLHMELVVRESTGLAPGGN